MFAFACTSYFTNIVLGLAAQLGVIRLGFLHHVLYALVFALAVLALWSHDGWGMWLVVTVLSVFPFARPRTPWHPGLAAIGALGYVLAGLGF